MLDVVNRFEEIQGCLSFVSHVYTLLGFTFGVKLSTRPEKFLGEPSVWDKCGLSSTMRLLFFTLHRSVQNA